jgi:hypothetical protein
MLAFLGALLVLFTLHDVVSTTLLPRNGALSGRLTARLWRAALWLHWRADTQHPLALAGVGLLLTTVAVWALLLWAGWALVFLAGRPSVLMTQGGEAADPWAVVYFTGYTLITLGNGDFRPAGPSWQLLAVLASMSGFFLFTLSITFLFSVVQAAVGMRATAVYISSLGDTPFDLLARAYDGKSCRALTTHISPLVAQLSTISQQHLAYPVLHYLHSASRYNALPIQVAVLDEALSHLRAGVLECGGLEDAELAPLERAIGAFLLTLKTAHHEAADEAPPLRSLAELHRYGLPAAAPLTEERAAAPRGHDDEHRRLLLALVEKDGWSWEDLYRSGGALPSPREKLRRGEVKHPYA